MASENSRETLGVRNAFSYVDIGSLEGSNPKAILNFNSSMCDYKYCIIMRTKICEHK